MCNTIQERFQEALDSFVEKIQQDKYVLAAILGGSLAYDTVWEKSDIDLILIVDETQTAYRPFTLVENGIIINASIFSRHQFKRQFESSLRSGQFHSMLSKSTLLFTKDETIRDLYENLLDVGSGDKELLLLYHGTLAVATLTKAQKFLLVKRDPLYSYFWLMKGLDSLAAIEVLTRNEIPSREALHQALQFNPEFFTEVYIRLSEQVKNFAVMQHIFELVEHYLEAHTPSLFLPVLEILTESGGDIVPASAIHKRLALKLNLEPALLVEAYEWLVEKSIIEKFPASARLTVKSRVQVDEAAYYYSGSETTTEVST